MYRDWSLWVGGVYYPLQLGGATCERVLMGVSPRGGRDVTCVCVGRGALAWGYE